MKELKQDYSEDTPISNPQQYDQNLEKMALTMLTKGSIKHKVRDFKTRVYGLLILYLEKIKSVDLFVKALVPILTEIQPSDIPKLDNLLRQALKKSGTIQITQVKTLIEHYKKLLVKTARWKDSKKITQTFSLLLKTLLQQGVDQQEVKNIIVGLQDIYIYKRGVKIHIETLQYLVKKFKFVKETFQDHLQKALTNESLREAMKKQVRKMTRWFGKTTEVKFQ